MKRDIRKPRVPADKKDYFASSTNLYNVDCQLNIDEKVFFFYRKNLSYDY